MKDARGHTAASEDDTLKNWKKYPNNFRLTTQEKMRLQPVSFIFTFVDTLLVLLYADSLHHEQPVNFNFELCTVLPLFCFKSKTE